MTDDKNRHPVELISAFLDGEADAREAAAVEGHLRSCAECRALLEDLRRLAAASAAEAVPPVPEALPARIRWRLRAHDAGSGPRAGRRRWWRSPLAQRAAAGPPPEERSLFESVIVSTRKRGSTRQWLTLPIALAVHAIIFAVLAVASFLTVETIQAPPLTISFAVAPPPPPPPPPPPARKKSASEAPKVLPTVKAEIVQPTLVPKETPAPGPATGSDEGEDYGEEGGMEGGVEGGVVGGVIGGVVGGVVGGVSGGLLGSEPLQAGIGGVTNPELILETRVQPKYPEIARKAKVAGRVILQAIVRQDGSVGDIQVLSSPGKNFGFDESAVEAVRQWRYKPGLQNGKPVDVYFTVVVEFTLK